MKALVHGNLIDGTGSDPLIDATVIIDDEGRITATGRSIEPPVGAEVTDVSGRTIMPGLIDCHVHFMFQVGRSFQQDAGLPLTFRVLEGAQRARDTLDGGVTTVRDTGYTPVGFKMAAERGIIDAPRMRIAINNLSQTGGHGDSFLPSGIRRPLASSLSYENEWPVKQADGVDGVRLAVRKLLRTGADFIKMSTSGGVFSPSDEPWHTQFTIEEIRTAVYEANAQGTYVAAHAQGLNGIKNAIEGGVRTIEHGVYLDEETADKMIERGLFLVPTLHAPQGILKAEKKNPGSVMPQALRKVNEVFESHKTNLRMAIEKGVKVAMGTDAGVGLHGKNAEELNNLVNLGGMSPVEAITAATKTAAECMRMEADVGTLEPGRFADLLVVDGDPTDDIRVLEDRSNLLVIMQGGSKHKDLIGA